MTAFETPSRRHAVWKGGTSVGGGWDVLGETDRLQWGCVPFESVGPLCFGMGKAEAEASAAGALEFWTRRPQGDGVISWTACLERRGREPMRPAADLYFTASDELFCIAINGRFGPQVTVGGLRLVGRVPSDLEAEFVANADQIDGGLRYSISADPAATALGVVLCSQRAGDLAVSRPVFVGRKWSDMFWDNSEGWIPAAEWPQIYL